MVLSVSETNGFAVKEGRKVYSVRRWKSSQCDMLRNAILL